MGAALSSFEVPELSRHQKHRVVRRRPKPHQHRHKDAPQPGYSSSDWAQLARKDPDLAGLQGQPPRRGITLEEVARHAGEEDAWMALRGRVYNVTPYLRFHPGSAGVLLEAAGRDATELFDRFHRWVDVDTYLDRCLVGWLEEQPAEQAQACLLAAAEQQQAAAQQGQQQALQPGPEEQSPPAQQLQQPKDLSAQQQMQPREAAHREAASPAAAAAAATAAEHHDTCSDRPGQLLAQRNKQAPPLLLGPGGPARAHLRAFPPPPRVSAVAG